MPLAGLGSGWPKARPESGEPPAARVSRHVGSEGIADQGAEVSRRRRQVLTDDSSNLKTRCLVIVKEEGAAGKSWIGEYIHKLDKYSPWLFGR